MGPVLNFYRQRDDELQLKHDLKIWPQFYARVLDGSKTFEVRENDRNFQRGDFVTLREWDPEPLNKTTTGVKGYTNSEPLDFEIGFVYALNDKDHKVVFSLLPLKKSK